MDDIERYKADMERARDAGITFAAVRDIMSAHADDGPNGESFGRMVERIRDLALQAAAQMAAEERAAVVKWLRAEAEAAAQTYTVQAGQWANRIDGLADDIARGEHRREEEK